MEWNEVLDRLHALVGQRVSVSVSIDQRSSGPGGRIPGGAMYPPTMSKTGMLMRGDDTRSRAVAEAFGRAVPHDDVLTFLVDDDSTFSLARSRFTAAGPTGVGSAFYVVQDFGAVTVMDYAEEERLGRRIHDL